MSTTTDFSKFGSRERQIVIQLLNSWENQGLPKDFYEENVTFMMNTSSGNVFLTNEDYQVAMMNGHKLESFYSCPICGHEGFLDEIQHNKDEEECQEWVKEVEGLSFLCNH